MLKYTIQFHKSKKHHYDLRLEYKGVAKSWAIPKGPSKNEGEKRLAVQVEDHAVKYMSFEGEIPEGQYGAGKVELWDNGWWEAESISDKKIVAIIHGKKLKGKYALVHFKDKNWLFFKVKEDKNKNEKSDKSNK